MTSIPFRCPNFLPNLPLSPQPQQQQQQQKRKNLLKKIWGDSDLFQILLQHSYRDKISRRKTKNKKHLQHRKKKTPEKNPYQQNQEKKTSTRDCEDQRERILNREQHSTNNRDKRRKVSARARNTVFCAPLVQLAQWRNSSRTIAHVARSNLFPGAVI